MSRLRRPFLDDRYLFATVNLLSNLEERYFGRSAISLVRMRQEVGSANTLRYLIPLDSGEAAERRRTVATARAVGC